MSLAERIIQAAKVDPGVTALVLIDRCRELESDLIDANKALTACDLAYQYLQAKVAMGILGDEGAESAWGSGD